MQLPLQPPIEPMLARLSPEIPSGEAWHYEPKWDGFRALVFFDGQDAYLQSRDLKRSRVISRSSRRRCRACCRARSCSTARS